MCSFARLQRLYQVRPLRMLDTAKKRGVTLLYWMLAGGRFFVRKVAGESFSGLGTDCTVRSARWSFIFIQNLNLADDAAHRRSLALTYMGLLQNEKHPASDQDRAIILNALFRPIPPQTNDEGPPAGLIELIRK